MNAYIREINELTDSREMLEAKPHPFVPIFIYLLLFLVAAVILWSCLGEMDIVAKANAVVRPNEKISSIQTSVSAKVERVTYTQGAKVRAGDILLVLDSDELDVQKQATEQKLLEEKKELENLNTLKSSIEQHQNLFNKNEKEYYEEYLKYEVEYKKLRGELEQAQLQLTKAKKEMEHSKNAVKEKEQLLSSSKKNEQLTIQSLEQEKKRLEELLNNLQKLEKSYTGNKNYFTDKSSVYFNQYAEFQNTVTQLQNNIEQKRAEYERSKFLGEQYVPKSKIEQDRIAYEAAKLELQNYVNTKIQTVRLDIQENKQKLIATKLELQKLNEASSVESQQQGIKSEKSYLEQKTQSLQQEILLHGDLAEVTLEKFKTDKLVEVNESIKQQEEIIKELEDKINAINVQANNYQITAPIDGIVNVHQIVNEGDIVHPGEPIITIIPESQSQYKMVLSVLNKDISKMEVGDRVKYHFLALPYKEYGALEGKITKISTDAVVNPEDGVSYYTVEATIENKPLYSYKGKKAHIKVGMQAEAIVVTDSKKILYYMLEKINLKD